MSTVCALEYWETGVVFIKNISRRPQDKLHKMLRVGQITAASTLLKHFYQTLRAKEGWRPCVGDVDSYLRLDPTGVYYGEINNKPVATYSAIKYAGGGFVHVGSNIIEEKYRCRGFGVQLEDSCLEKLASFGNMAGYYPEKMARKAEKRLGMVSRWPVGIYDVNISRALKILREHRTDCCEVKTIGQICMQDVCIYDTNVFGYERKKFLESWLNARGSHVRFAVDKKRLLVGYVAVRLAFIRDEGYKIGPLFCENIQVAKALLKEVFEDICERGLASSQSAVADSPIEANCQAEQLMQSLDAEYLGSMEFMTTNGIPKGDFDQWYAIASPVSG